MQLIRENRNMVRISLSNIEKNSAIQSFLMTEKKVLLSVASGPDFIVFIFKFFI